MAATHTNGGDSVPPIVLPFPLVWARRRYRGAKRKLEPCMLQPRHLLRHHRGRPERLRRTVPSRDSGVVPILHDWVRAGIPIILVHREGEGPPFLGSDALEVTVKTSTKVLLALWVVLGLPMTYLVNIWGSDWWAPFPIVQDEAPSYYFAWFVTFGLVYLLPAWLLVRALYYILVRALRRV